MLPSDKSDGVEILVQVAGIDLSLRKDRISGCFSFSAALGDSDDFTLIASADIEVLVHVDKSTLDLLPARETITPELVPVEKEQFYTSLERLGCEYRGAFRSLADLKRKHGKASCVVQLQTESTKALNSNKDYADDADSLLHPAGLDSAFQSLLLAYSYPGDHNLRKLHLPLSIDCIRVNPALCDSRAQHVRSTIKTKNIDEKDMAYVDAVIVRPGEEGRILSCPDGGFSRDINIHTAGSPHAAVKVVKVHLVPLVRSVQHSGSQ